MGERRKPRAARATTDRVEPGADVALARLRAELDLSRGSATVLLWGTEPPGLHPFKLGTAAAVAAGLRAPR